VTALVSIVVPAYNNADHIERTMDSILAQTYPHLEIIVADHSSTDDTWKLLQRYADDPRVTLLTTEAGGGALRNWNRVSQAATGDYVKLVCGDDLIYPRLVEEQVAGMEQNPGVVLAASKRDIIDASDRPLVRGRGLGGLHGVVDGRRAVRSTVVRGTNIFGEPGCVLMKRDALESAGWWDSSFPYLIDQTTYSRVLLEGDLFAIGTALAGFRVSDTQWSVRLARSQADQAVGFHHWLRETHPDVVSSADVARGDLMARANARGRRLVYALFKNRMRAR
jgi:glycosyltransferase involved in cell wall biosynthesis